MAWKSTAPVVLEEPVLGPDLVRSVTDFIGYEAWCMDENRYDAWMALWEPELLYWVPINNDDHEPGVMVAIINDNRTQLEQRMTRLKSRLAYSQQPKSRMLRVVGNVNVLSDEGDTVIATSTFTMGEFRIGRQEIYLGRNIHVLKKRDGRLRMSEKKVLLLNNDDALGNLTFLV